jgi:hypothetical protein
MPSNEVLPDLARDRMGPDGSSRHSLPELITLARKAHPFLLQRESAQATLYVTNDFPTFETKI